MNDREEDRCHCRKRARTRGHAFRCPWSKQHGCQDGPCDPCRTRIRHLSWVVRGIRKARKALAACSGFIRCPVASRQSAASACSDHRCGRSGGGPLAVRFIRRTRGYCWRLSGTWLQRLRQVHDPGPGLTASNRSHNLVRCD